MYNIEPFIFIFRNGEYKVHGIRSIWVSIYNVDEMSFHPKMLRFPWVLIKADIWMIWADIWMSWVLIPVSQQPPSGWFELIAGWLELWSILGRFILLDNLHQLFSGISAWPAHIYHISGEYIGYIGFIKYIEYIRWIEFWSSAPLGYLGLHTISHFSSPVLKIYQIYCHP